VAASGVNGRTTPIRISAVTLSFGQQYGAAVSPRLRAKEKRTMNESVRRLRSQISGAPNLIARHSGNRAPWRPTRTYWAKVQ
jgi:hypothetical protein